MFVLTVGFLKIGRHLSSVTSVLWGRKSKLILSKVERERYCMIWLMDSRCLTHWYIILGIGCTLSPSGDRYTCMLFFHRLLAV